LGERTTPTARTSFWLAHEDPEDTRTAKVTIHGYAAAQNFISTGGSSTAPTGHRYSDGA